MYYIDEITERAFDNFGKMINANDDSFWAPSSLIEAKPSTGSTDPDTTTQTQEWEAADESTTTTHWSSTERSTTITDSTMSDVAGIAAASEIADVVSEVIEDANPFSSDSDSNMFTD